ncbi:MAG TPA: DHH family phosphoesterase [Methanocorpusculum sp.]|nr:DHH family phosphoesterase [Methanocorpusculum sp.]HJJ58432.1 DHH family phosphoesterase [Methanocorpusculum sp.]HJJ59272.1 DHH family phosphoesterase [Methanocorpusculum sp.]
MVKKKVGQTELEAVPKPAAKKEAAAAPVKVAETPAESPNKKIKYIIFGCGSLGYNILEELHEDDENVLLIDIDEKRLQDLRDHRHQVMAGDMLSDELYTKIPEPEAAFVVSASKEVNLSAVVNLHNKFPQCNIVARSTDPFSTEELADNGADVALYPQTVFARSALNHMEVLRATRSAQKLHNQLSSWEGALGIITHKNPDPDAISSAMALTAIAEDAAAGKLKCRILYEGNIGHQENRAFVNLFEIKMERLTPEILAECSHLALVDCGGPGINNDLPADTPVEIIIDHHSQEGVVRKITPEFVDIREEAGATASILTQYIQELYITISTKVATALFYGIRSDTKDFQRNIYPQDMHNAAYLLPFTDKALLEVVMTPSMSKETLDIMGRAIQNSVIKQGYLGSNVGYIRNRDALPQAAEMLLNLEGVNTAFVYGITDTAIVCSGRNRDVRLHLGDVMKEALSSIPGASAGGHATMAALSIPLSTFSLAKDKEKLLDMVIEPIMKNIMRLLGLTKDDGENESQKETRV